MQLDAIGWLNILQNVENDITLGDFVREQPFLAETASQMTCLAII